MKRLFPCGLIVALVLAVILAGCGGGGNTTQYTLNIARDGQGSVGVDPAGGTKYNAGTVVTLTPDPEAHWTFLLWDGMNKVDVVDDGGAWKITMNGDKSIIARFVQITCNLTVNITGEGTVNQVLKPKSRESYNEGDIVTLTALPAKGWQFDHWEDGLTGNTNPQDITMDTDKAVRAVFADITYGVSGRVTQAGVGLAGVALSFGADFGSVTTAVDGTWSKTGLWGTVTVSPSKEGYDFSPPIIQVSGARSDANFTVPYWQTVGTAGFSGVTSDYVYMALDESDTPFVAYGDSSNGYKGTVKKFSGTNWESVGGAGFSDGSASWIHLEFDCYGGLYVAYRDDGNGSRAFVRKLNGANWEVVGGASVSAGAAWYTSLAFNGGTPYVAYRDGSNSGKATVMKFDSVGGSWVPIGSTGFSAGEVWYTSLAFNSYGTPYVAYQDVSDYSRLTVMKFDGMNWVPVGNTGFSAGSAHDISLVLDSDGAPYVAYRDWGNGNEGRATVMKFDGSEWTSVGSVGFSAGEAISLSMALDSSGTPYVAFHDVCNGNKATVMRFSGICWELVGNAGFSAGQAVYISLAFDKSDTPYIACLDDINGATVMKYAP